MKDPNDTRNAAPRPGSPLWIDMTAITAAGTVVIALAAYMLRSAPHIPPLHNAALFWVVALMILAGEAWRIITPGKTGPESPAVSVTISFATLLYWGFPIAVLFRAAAIVAAGLVQRKSLHRALFNAAQISLSLGAAGLTLAAAGITPSLDSALPRLTGADLPLVLLAGAAYFIVNFSMVVLAISLYSRVPIGAVIRSNLRYQALSHLVLFATAPLATVAMETGSARIVALFAIPLAAIYLNAATSVQREHQANHDELTGLCNRKLLIRHTTEALARASAVGTRAGFLLLDLDRSSGLKEVNDTLGHAVGDQMLKTVAHRLTRSVRPGDVVARLGGDEFAVLLPSVREPTAAREVAARLRAALSEPVRLEAMTFDLHASVGIAIYPDDAIGFDQLMQRADVAMYLAKEQRSGIERYVPEADRNSADRLALVGDLRRALHRGEIELHFQPKVLLATGRVIGIEALARWRHPQRGMLTAADFIRLAEQSYLMSELTDQVIVKALDQAAKWWVDGMRIEVSVNVPPRDLLSDRLADLIGRELQHRGLPASALRLDVDEQVLTGKSEQAASTVRSLTDLGIGVSLDGFGTGNCSLALLTGLGISEVKLAPALITELPAYRDKSVSVKSLVSLARTLGIRSIAEGVETEAVADALRAVGCDGAQGWLYARPLTADQATRWLSENFAPAWVDARVGVPALAGAAKDVPGWAGAAAECAAAAARTSVAATAGEGARPGGEQAIEQAGNDAEMAGLSGFDLTGHQAGEPEARPVRKPGGWPEAELARATQGG